MTSSSPSRWEEIRARKLADPAARERYERTRRSIMLSREVLQAIEAERERAGLSKAKLAHRVGVNPSAIRRMLTSQSSNPTLRTVAEVLDALGLELKLRRKAGTGRAAGQKRMPLPRRRTSGSVEPWDVKVFQRHRDDDPRERCPSEEFLESCPDSVAADLIAIVDSVASLPPPQFTGGGMWEAMHGTPFSDADYARVRRLGEEYRRRTPRSVV